MYFTNSIGFYARKDGNHYASKQKLRLPLDSFDVRDPVIAPNEDYLIFTRLHSTKKEDTDLFVSFAKEDGSWSKPVDLGPAINTEQFEFAPYISPDEKFLFFSRRDQWTHAEASKIYWVSIDWISSLKRQDEDTASSYLSE